MQCDRFWHSAHPPCAPIQFCQMEKFTSNVRKEVFLHLRAPNLIVSPANAVNYVRQIRNDKSPNRMHVYTFFLPLLLLLHASLLAPFNIIIMYHIFQLFDALESKAKIKCEWGRSQHHLYIVRWLPFVYTIYERATAQILVLMPSLCSSEHFCFPHILPLLLLFFFSYCNFAQQFSAHYVRNKSLQIQ